MLRNCAVEHSDVKTPHAVVRECSLLLLVDRASHMEGVGCGDGSRDLQSHLCHMSKGCTRTGTKSMRAFAASCNYPQVFAAKSQTHVRVNAWNAMPACTPNSVHNCKTFFFMNTELARVARG